jgi:hypothetical protein
MSLNHYKLKFLFKFELNVGSGGKWSGPSPNPWKKALTHDHIDAGASFHASQSATSARTHSKDEGRRSLIYICIECNKMV